MKCPRCQNELRDNAKFCTKCGFKIDTICKQPEFNDMQPAQNKINPAYTPKMGKCSVCGADLLEGVRFCTSCGKRIENEISPCLIRMKDNTMIRVNSMEFIIGKKRELVNYCIPDNKTVSRVHAKIVNRGGKYFIIDMDSTNHTYVNGSQIPSNVEIPIGTGARIRLSNEEFQFILQ